MNKLVDQLEYEKRLKNTHAADWFDNKILMLRDILIFSLFRTLADPHPRMRGCGSA